MGSRLTVRALALLVAFVFALSISQGAWAQGKTQLPQIKQPNSERFDITGKITSTSSSTTNPASDIDISGSGAVSGSNLEENLSINASPASQQSSLLPSFSFDLAVVDGKAYIKAAGAGTGTPDQWYVVDIPQGSNLGTFNPAASIIPSDPTLAQAYTVTQVGKEDVDGAPTTKYQVDIDFSKLLAGIGASLGQTPTPTPTPTPEPGIPDIGSDIQSQIFVWIGDNDQYLHKLTESVSTKITGTDRTKSPDFSTEVDITILFKDFDQPITITAPANAKPLDVNGVTNPDNPALQGLASSLLSNPSGAGLGSMTGMPVGMPSMLPGAITTPPTVGMPRTGSGAAGGLWLLVALGLAFISVGIIVRRRAEYSR